MELLLVNCPVLLSTMSVVPLLIAVTVLLQVELALSALNLALLVIVTIPFYNVRSTIPPVLCVTFHHLEIVLVLRLVELMEPKLEPVLHPLLSVNNLDKIAPKLVVSLVTVNSVNGQLGILEMEMVLVLQLVPFQRPTPEPGPLLNHSVVVRIPLVLELLTLIPSLALVSIALVLGLLGLVIVPTISHPVLVLSLSIKLVVELFVRDLKPRLVHVVIS